MSIPAFKDFLLPVLEIFGDGSTHSVDECCEIMQRKLGLSDEEASELLPSGSDTRLRNRTYWALVYFCHALVLDKPKKANYSITDRGRELLNSNPGYITRRMLRDKYPEFADFYMVKKSRDEKDNTENDDTLTPEDELEKAYSELKRGLAEELLNNLYTVNPYKFEHIVMDLLGKMGYGGSFDGSVKVTKKSNDGGIDGIINQDRLGLDKIFMQAKRWQNSVGDPEIREFIGSLSTNRVNKGIFITTSYFTDKAKDCAKNTEKTIILIEGKELANMMVDYGIGVQSVHSYDVKILDADFFEMNR